MIMLFCNNAASPRNRFGTIEAVCESLQVDEFGRHSMGQRVFAGAMASIVETILIGAPLETVMTQMIKDTTKTKPKLKGAIAAYGFILLKHGEALAGKIFPIDRFLPSFCVRFRRAGIPGLYRGTFTIIARQVFTQIVRLLVFESGRDAYHVQNPGKPMPLLGFAGLGATSGIISVACTAPIDFVKTRMQGLFWNRYSSHWDCVRTVYLKEGVAAFFRGSALRMLRVSIDIAYSSVFYEFMINAMERHWK